MEIKFHEGAWAEYPIRRMGCPIELYTSETIPEQDRFPIRRNPSMVPPYAGYAGYAGFHGNPSITWITLPYREVSFSDETC